MEKKIGVYICTDCDIGKSLNVDQLVKVATKLKAPIVKTHPFLCEEEKVQLIKKDIEEGVNAVVIAACSGRVMYDVFNFGNILLERVNLREGVVWTHPPNDEDTQMMAEDYLRMGILKIQKMELPEPYLPPEGVSKNILVVGGGIAGITAATEAAKAGYDVFLVEKSESLGGWMAQLYKQAPTKPPYTSIEDVGISDMIKEVQQNPKIKVYTSSVIEKIVGSPGLFDVTVRQNGNVETFRAGAIVVATGFKPYDATKLDHLGFGKYANVITNYMMEEFASKGKILRPSDGKPVKSVAFIQCAGQRDEAHLPYCSATCCVDSLKQAKYIRDQDPDSKAYILYSDMCTPGHYELFYKVIQNDPGISLTKGVVKNITEDEGKNLVVELEDAKGEKILLNVDLAVLAVGMVPVTAFGVEELPPGVKPGDEFIPYVMIESDILNLDYRQGGEVPVLVNGYPDSNFICFPYESRRTGIYPTGPVRNPMDIPSTIVDATGAALKAIQCVEMTSRGEALHPRSGDMSYADLFMAKCTQCKRCTEECPFGAFNEDEKANPIYNPTRCRRCAICMGACPERIISFKDYSIDMIGTMVKNIEVPEEEEKPRAIVFACENDAYPALDVAGINRLNYNPFIRVVSLRCLGSFNLVWVADALSKGVDGILLLGCQYGDDYQCHMATGSHLAKIRLGKVAETLDRLKLEAGRVQMEQISISEYYRVPEILDGFMERLKEFGPNPYKGF